mgnify:CR=1 FL=1
MTTIMTKRYRVTIGGDIAEVDARNANDAKRIAQRMYRSICGLSPNDPTPEPTAKIIKKVTK